MHERLHDYIDKHSRWHSYKKIKELLIASGWNEQVIDHAIRNHSRKKDATYLFWSMIFVIAVFTIVVGVLMFFREGTEGEVVCLRVESGKYASLDDVKSCCARISPTGCTTMKETIVYKDSKGSILFSSNTRCEADDGVYIMKPDLVLRC